MSTSVPVASLRMANPCFSALNQGKSNNEKFFAIFPCNPLKSLIRDEKIQGNPRKSLS